MNNSYHQKCQTVYESTKSHEDIKVEHNIHVGKVLNAVAKRPEQYFTARACREHTQMQLLPMLEIAIRIGGY